MVSLSLSLLLFLPFLFVCVKLFLNYISFYVVIMDGKKKHIPLPKMRHFTPENGVHKTLLGCYDKHMQFICSKQFDIMPLFLLNVNERKSRIKVCLVPEENIRKTLFLLLFLSRMNTKTVFYLIWNIWKAHFYT